MAIWRRNFCYLGALLYYSDRGDVALCQSIALTEKKFRLSNTSLIVQICDSYLEVNCSAADIFFQPHPNFFANNQPTTPLSHCLVFLRPLHQLRSFSRWQQTQTQ
jgi:hypothetical protein